MAITSSLKSGPHFDRDDLEIVVEAGERPRGRRPAAKVRSYTAADQRAVEALVVGLLEQEFIALRPEDRRLLSELEHDYGRETLLVAVDGEPDHGVIGVVALQADGPRIGRVRLLTVTPDERRRGVGTQLVAAVLQEASARGFDDLVLDARRGDEGAALFLTLTGFRLMAVTLHTSIFVRGVEDPLTPH